MSVRGAAAAMTVLTAGQTAGQTASWAALVAALPLAMGRPDAGPWVAAVTACWGAPAACSQFALKGVADAFGPRVTGTLSWMACAGAALAAARSPALLVVLPALIVASAARGMAVVAGDLAPTWLPRPPDLSRAGSWLMLAAALPLLAGPAGATGMIARWGPGTAWAGIAVLFAIGGVCSVLVPAVRPFSPDARPARATAPLSGRSLPSTVSGALAVTAAVWLTYGALEILQPLYVYDRLHASLGIYSWTMAAFAAGGIAMSLTSARLPAIAAGRWSIAAAVATIAAGETLMTTTGRVGVALAGAAVWGASAALLSLASRSLIVSAIPGDRHGRVLGTWRALQAASNAIPAAFIGWIVERAGLGAAITLTCWLAGITAAVFMVVTWYRPRPSPAGRGRTRVSREAMPASVAVPAQSTRETARLSPQPTRAGGPPGPAAWQMFDRVNRPAGGDLARFAVAARGMTKVCPASGKRGPRTSVSGLDLTVEAGSVFGLLGPNGSGKTTALNMLAGLTEPTSGTVTIFGQSPRDPAARWLIGVVTQESASFAQPTARANLMAHAAVYGFAGAEARRRTDIALDLAGLRDLADDPVRDFSGGMRRRLQIAQQMLHGPRALFMDAPAVGVDPAQRAALERSVRELAAAGAAVVLTTGSLDEAARLCERVAVIDHGRLVAEDAPAQLQSRYGHVEIAVRVSGTEQACRAALDDAVTIRGVTGARGREIAPGSAHLVITTGADKGITGRVLAALIGNERLAVIDVETSPPTLDEAFGGLAAPDLVPR